MKVYARRVEAPEPQKPYGTKWQCVVLDDHDGDPAFTLGEGPEARRVQTRYFDRVVLVGVVAMDIHEDENPAIYLVPDKTCEVWVDYRSSVTGLVYRVRLQ